MNRIRSMTAADIALGMRLKQEAGWNQTEADWRRCLALEPAGCFVAELDGAPVGTATTCLFGPVAWVAMVLVDTNLRGQGIGKALMKHALEFLDAADIRSVRLDATPLGQPLYEKLGFVAQFQLTRYEGMLPPARPTTDVTTPLPDQLEEVVGLDQAITATDRGKYLKCLFEDVRSSLRVSTRAGRLNGFSTVRVGSRAVQLGVYIAESEAGPELFADTCQCHQGRHVYIDVPDANTDAANLARSLTLTPQRQLTRMCRGPLVQERISQLWASSGPEKG
jgi:predicted N-acetyltransferase YhbS